MINNNTDNEINKELSGLQNNLNNEQRHNTIFLVKMLSFSIEELGIIAIVLNKGNGNQRKRCWVHKTFQERKSDEVSCIKKYILEDEEIFYNYFRMSKFLFYYLSIMTYKILNFEKQ